MSRQQIQLRINRGEVFPRYNAGDVVGVGIYAYTQPTIDSLEFDVRVVTTNDTPSIKISFYRFVNGQVRSLSTTTITQYRARFTQDFAVGDYFIEIQANCVIAVTGKPLHFVSVKTFTPAAYQSEHMVATLTTKRKPRDCAEALEYELIDGELPPGIGLHKDGLLWGVVDELDCIDESMSPSFNWYFDNHDGVMQSWGRRWRFKVRARIASQPDVFSDEWLCLRVYNNWSVDAAAFATSEDTVVYEHHSTITRPVIEPICPTPVVERFVPKRQITELPRYNRAADCVPCQDPTTPHKEESFGIPSELRLRTPDEVIRYYINNQNNFEMLVMQLHTSELFQELLKHLRKPTDAVFEMNIDDSKLSIKKWWLETGSALDDVDSVMLANVTITGQVNPVDIVGYGGEYMEGVLTW